MTALSELIHTSEIDPARAIERIAKSPDHKMDRATIYRYVEGRRTRRGQRRSISKPSPTVSTFSSQMFA